MLLSLRKASSRNRSTLWSVAANWFSARLYGTIDPAAPLGVRGEQAAAVLLRKKGLRIVAKNYRDRGGEVDLIAIDNHRRRKKTVVFVEVKTLGSTRPGNPADRVDEGKQRRLTQLALRFLKRRKLLEYPVRFDVVAVWWPDKSALMPERLEHYVDAFPATGLDSFFS